MTYDVPLSGLSALIAHLKKLNKDQTRIQRETQVSASGSSLIRTPLGEKSVLISEVS